MKLLNLLFFYLFTQALYAHPVAYEGAYSFMSNNTSLMSENTFLYSPKYWLGTGVKHVQMDEKKWTNLHLGFLVKRWNELESQGNLYLFGGPGFFKTDSSEEYFSRYGLQGDWESRSFYTMFKYSGASSNSLSFNDYTGRIGFAPFVAGYNDLNVWAILQVQHIPNNEDETIVTPLIRMFYKTVLWEAGASIDGKWLLNFMVRY